MVLARIRCFLGLTIDLSSLVARVPSNADADNWALTSLELIGLREEPFPPCPFPPCPFPPCPFPPFLSTGLLGFPPSATETLQRSNLNFRFPPNFLSLSCNARSTESRSYGIYGIKSGFVQTVCANQEMSCLQRIEHMQCPFRYWFSHHVQFERSRYHHIL